MSEISTQQIKELRDKTGAGISDAKKALEENGGDLEKAVKAIEHKFGGTALKKASRETKAGLVEAYVHSNGRVASLIELYCETDFVARNPDFKALAHALAMQVAAMNPLYLSLETIPADVWQEEKNRFEEEVRKLGKPQEIQTGIVEGKLKAYFGGRCLLDQPFIREQEKTVAAVITEAIGRFGENIRVGKFSRLEI